MELDEAKALGSIKGLVAEAENHSDGQEIGAETWESIELSFERQGAGSRKHEEVVIWQ